MLLNLTGLFTFDTERIFDNLAEFIDEHELFSNARTIIKQDLGKLCSEDLNNSESSTFMVVLLEFMHEHSFEINENSLQERISELLENALVLFEEYTDSDGNDNDNDDDDDDDTDDETEDDDDADEEHDEDDDDDFTPFGHFEIEFVLPTGPLWKNRQKPGCFETNDRENLGTITKTINLEYICNMQTAAIVERKVFSKKIEYWIYFGVEISEKVLEIDVRNF